MIVVDASVLVAALADDEASGERARARLRDDVAWHAPSLVDLEVVSVLRHRLLAGDLDDRRARSALDDLAAVPMSRYPHLELLDRVWDLRETVTPYDAAYVVLAEALGCVLVTADARLARAPGPRCAIELVVDPRAG